MNLTDYEGKYFYIYEAFAETVRFILKKALLAADNLPRPQSIQCRAKGLDSLRRRLSEQGKLDSQTLELERRDLAGVRLIFYTNNDVDRFLNSHLIRENFEIEWDSTKIHHPIPENEKAQYRAIHYTVRLREDRICLPEYKRFESLRCEIQVQTILNHAWSETSHDILYKRELGDGYGSRAMEGISRRFERIMDKYLIPAGFEIQKAQQEYERILQGKEIFDKDIANLLDKAKNNNERYEILSGLKDYAIPNYDDLPEAYEGLKGPLLRAVKTARGTEPAPIETTFGDMEGFKADAVTKVVLEIIQNLRYVDVIGTLQLLIDIYRDEPNDDIRKQIVDTTKNLSEYNIDVYNKVGPMLQIALVDHLARMSAAEVDNIRPIALTVWTEAIKSDISGTTWKADSVILRSGAVPVSDKLREVRNKAIEALFEVYERSTDDTQKREILAALDAATRTPVKTEYSNELISITLKDAARIVSFVTGRIKAISYELLQHLENQFLYYNYRAKDLSEDQDNRFGCQVEAAKLVSAIVNFRDTINTDSRFVRYKVLVGFKSVFPNHWTERKFDFRGATEYRREEADRYIDEINAENENDWFDLIERCAETESNDLATFQVFGNFVSKLAERKPELAEKFLSKASDKLRNFLAGFLNGLALSGRNDIYERILANELESARNLTGIVHHLRYSDVTKPDFVTRLMKRVIEKGDSVTVTEFLLLSLDHYGTDKIADADTLLRYTLAFLNDRKDCRWVSEAWFLEGPNNTKFYEELSPEITSQILQNLSFVPNVNYQVEQVLAQLAKHQPEVIWDYFGDRIATETVENVDEGNFDAVPFEFNGLEKELSKNPQLAIKKGLSWFAKGPKLFQYRGGRLLSNTFPLCPPEFSTALAESVKAGGDTEAEFALAILQNYHGERSTYEVLKEIVSQFPDDESKMIEVRCCIDSTGVVSGSFGFAGAYRSKKESLTEWLADERPEVRAFAKRHIVELDRRIAAEQRQAETEIEMRNRDYDEDDDSEDDDGSGDESAK